MAVVLGGGGPVLGLLDGFRAGFIFSVGGSPGRSGALSPLIAVTSLAGKGANTGINQGQCVKN